MSSYASRDRRPLYLDLTAVTEGLPAGEQSLEPIADGALQEVVAAAYHGFDDLQTQLRDALATGRGRPLNEIRVDLSDCTDAVVYAARDFALETKTSISEQLDQDDCGATRRGADWRARANGALRIQTWAYITLCAEARLRQAAGKKPVADFIQHVANDARDTALVARAVNLGAYLAPRRLAELGVREDGSVDPGKVRRILSPITVTRSPADTLTVAQIQAKVAIEKEAAKSQRMVDADKRNKSQAEVFVLAVKSATPREQYIALWDKAKMLFPNDPAWTEPVGHRTIADPPTASPPADLPLARALAAAKARKEESTIVHTSVGDPRAKLEVS